MKLPLPFRDQGISQEVEATLRTIADFQRGVYPRGTGDDARAATVRGDSAADESRYNLSKRPQ